jgi:hypothetical protein
MRCTTSAPVKDRPQLPHTRYESRSEPTPTKRIDVVAADGAKLGMLSS